VTGRLCNFRRTEHEFFNSVAEFLSVDVRPDQMIITESNSLLRLKGFDSLETELEAKQMLQIMGQVLGPKYGAALVDELVSDIVEARGSNSQLGTWVMIREVSEVGSFLVYIFIAS